MGNETYTWNVVLDQLSKRLSEPSFNTWFKPTKLKIEGDKWYIILPNDFARDWIETNYQSLIKDAIYETTNELPEVTLVVETKAMWASHLDDKTDHILNDINDLSLSKQENQVDLLKKRYPSSVRNDKAIESDRVDRLEKEVELIKDKLGEIMDRLERDPS